GHCGTREEAAVGGLRGPRRADRPAVDAGRRDADEKDAVEARVAGSQGLVEGGGVVEHGAKIARRSARNQPFSDRNPEPAGRPPAGRESEPLEERRVPLTDADTERGEAEARRLAGRGAASELVEQS